jgi:hypothetical protein
MRLSIQYLNDQRGNTNAVQLPLSDWNMLVEKIKKYEQILKVKSDLQTAFSEVKKMQTGKIKKQTLSEFLDEL